MKITMNQLREMVKQQLDERCQKGYKTDEKRKTKKMYGKTYRNCVKAEANLKERAALPSIFSGNNVLKIALKTALIPNHI